MASIPQVRIAELSGPELVRLFNALSADAQVVRFESAKVGRNRVARVIEARYPGTTFMDNGGIAVLPRPVEFDHDTMTFSEVAMVETPELKPSGYRLGENGVAETPREPEVRTPVERGKSKPKAEAPKAEARGRGRGRNFDRSRKIRVLVDANPRRQGSATYARFELYRDGMTVGEFLDAGGWDGDLRWDSARKFIRVEE